MVRDLLWGLSAVKREVRAWRARASMIPDVQLRDDALVSLCRKRGHTDGAALFSILPKRRNPCLLRLLVAYEIIWDFLDCVNERGADAGQRNGLQLHLALIEGLDPAVGISPYYQYHPWNGDGGYLCTLVEICRETCPLLPSYERVRPLVLQEARRAQVLGINHDPDASRRDAALREWARHDRANRPELTWFELTGAASASLTVHALLALATEPTCCASDLVATHAAYFPWISATTTMLDSYADMAEDARNGDHSYIAHYPDVEMAVERVCALVRRSTRQARALSKGTRHAVIVACMVAMYLSKDSARAPEMLAWTRRLAHAGGSLAMLLLPVLRLWRIVYGQRAS